MDRVITYNFGEDFIANLADWLQRTYLTRANDLSRLAIVFGGKRPALFLKRELARKIKKSYIPFRFFSIDEFVGYILGGRGSFFRIPDLDASYIIYNLAKEHAPQILTTREEFSQFLPWAREIAAFIDELDLEDVQTKSLEDIQVSAEIGYEIPESINTLLQNIISIRDAYHKALRMRNAYSRGLRWLEASKVIDETDLDEFEKILFCGFFYLHKTEEKIFKCLYEKDRAILFFQKDERPWPVLDKLAQKLACRIEPKNKTKPTYSLNISKGFDTHSQVGLVRENLKKIENFDNTVIVLPDANSLIPLLSEITHRVEGLNVSMGYPLKRSSLYGLFKSIFKAQATRKKDAYYTKDYLKVLLHPLVKNLMIAQNPAVTRVLAHKVEEILEGKEKTALSGSLFVKLDDIQNLKEIYHLAADTLGRMDIEQATDEFQKILPEVHQVAFRIWEAITNFSQFASTLEQFLNLLLAKSFVGSYPINLKIVEKIYAIKDELKKLEFSDQNFTRDDIFKIFDQKLETEIISFAGSPLKGLQILGLFETRSLSFDNVIMMDANESLLPKLRVYEPLIPRQIMVSLGLNRLEQEEEIQRYHFMRLISCSKNVWLVYDDSPEKLRSRFLEELIWQRQKEERSLEVITQPRARFNVEVLPKKGTMKKSKQVIEFLEDLRYSPSSIDTYLNCPLQFYYQYVLGLREKEELLDAPQGKDIGDFIHGLLEDTYREFLDKKPFIDDKFKNRFFKEFNRRFDQDLKKRMGPDAFMVKDIMDYRLKKFLDNEQQREVKRVVSLEDESLGGRIKLADSSFQFKCRIDRIDELEDSTILILDYKTGAATKAPTKLAKLESIEMDRRSIKETIRSFQLPLYYYFVRRKFKDLKLNAALYNLRNLDFAFFIRPEAVDTADRVMGICIKALGFILAEILNPQVDFEADESRERYCEYCPFFYLCR